MMVPFYHNNRMATYLTDFELFGAKESSKNRINNRKTFPPNLQSYSCLLEAFEQWTPSKFHVTDASFFFSLFTPGK